MSELVGPTLAALELLLENPDGAEPMEAKFSYV